MSSSGDWKINTSGKIKAGKAAIRTTFVIFHILILSITIYSFSNFNKYMLIGILNVLCPIITFVMLWGSVNTEKLLEKLMRES
jgi:hypothetical protein